MALELRPNCECCDRDLPPASNLARICSTSARSVRTASSAFSPTSVPTAGRLVPRPIRPATEWRPGLSVVKRPPSAKRVHLSFPRDDIAAHSNRIKDIAPEDR